MLCTVKKGNFVIQVINITGFEGKTILLGDVNNSGSVNGSLFLTSFHVCKSNNHPTNAIFISTFFSRKLNPNDDCADSRLWLHLMDGLGSFPGKHKGNITVRFELVVVGKTMKEKVDGEVVRAVTSSCSVNSRHLVWDQKMEMLINAEVMLAITKGAKRQSGSVDPLSADKKLYILRVSMWQHDSSFSQDSSSGTVLIAAAERNIADVLGPFLPNVSSYKGAEGTAGSSSAPHVCPPNPVRHEVVFPLRLLTIPAHADSTALSSSSFHHRAVSSDVRLRVGFLLLSNEEIARVEDIPAPPASVRRQVKDNGGHLPPPARPCSRGTLEATAERFMSKGGWYFTCSFLVCRGNFNLFCSYLLICVFSPFSRPVESHPRQIR